MSIRVYSDLGLTVPISAAFFPLVRKEEGKTMLKFSQAYILDYWGGPSVNTFKISGMSEEFVSGGRFVVKLSISDDSGRVSGANFGKDLEPSDDEDKAYYIPIADTNENGVTTMYVRENIHWMGPMKPGDRDSPAFLTYEKSGNSPQGKGAIKWKSLTFEPTEDSPFQVVGGTKEGINFYTATECPDEEDPYGDQV